MEKDKVHVPTWVERSGWPTSSTWYELILALGAIKIVVHWEERLEGYCVSVNGICVPGNFANLRNAKQAGLDLARKILNQATEELNAITGAGDSGGSNSKGPQSV